jgi:hypothetical protein
MNDSDDLPVLGQKFFPGITSTKMAFISPDGDQSLTTLDLKGSAVCYLEAAKELVQRLQVGAPDLIVQPMLFCIRHSIELILKAVLDYQNGTFADKHQLKDPWATCRLSFLSNHFDPKTLDAVEALIEELATIDSDSYAFRYPMSTAKTHRKPSLKPDGLQGVAFDIPNFVKVTTSLTNFVWEVFAILDDLQPPDGV